MPPHVFPIGMVFRSKMLKGYFSSQEPIKGFLPLMSHLRPAYSSNCVGFGNSSATRHNSSRDGAVEARRRRPRGRRVRGGRSGGASRARALVARQRVASRRRARRVRERTRPTDRPRPRRIFLRLRRPPRATREQLAHGEAPEASHGDEAARRARRVQLAHRRPQQRIYLLPRPRVVVGVHVRARLLRCVLYTGPHTTTASPW